MFPNSLYGRLKYFSFIILDIICILIANLVASRIYLRIGELHFYPDDYRMIVIIMIALDIIVTVFFNTLDQILRRGIKKEFFQCVKQVFINFVLLALILFSTKQGAIASRITVYLAYVLDVVLLFVFHMVWKKALLEFRKSQDKSSALLITTAGYANEGLDALEKTNSVAKGLFVTDKTNEGTIRDLPIIVDRKAAITFLCWEWIDRVYICGPEGMDVPDILVAVCQDMNIPVHTTSSNKRFEYEVIRIRTALQKNDESTGLSFFEAEHDIPFKINRLYMILPSEQDLQNGFHAHKKSWQLFFCPYGSIDILIDTGREKKHVLLDDPSIGLVLNPGIWREMTWKKSDSILCVAASGHYDVAKLKEDYPEYLRFLKEQDWSALLESSEIMGEAML